MNVSTIVHRHSDALETAAKVGWLVKGALYITLGMLAVLAAVGEGGLIEGSKGVLQWVVEQPFGRVLLVVAGVGFACYALWRFVQAALDPAKHEDEKKMVVKRIAWAASGVMHVALSVAAFQMVAGSGQSGGGKQAWIAKLLEAGTAGQVVLGILGGAIISAGLYQLKSAFELSFMEKVDRSGMSSREVSVLQAVGRTGLMARAVVFPIIGYFLIDAAISHSPSQARGVGGALGEAAQVSWYALAIIAAGLVGYGVLQLFYARYRQLELS